MTNIFEQTTLCYILNDKNQVLLIKKKKGLGWGKYNGPGGKVEESETPQECAVREIKEEIGLTLLDIEPRGYIEFITDGLEFDGRCYIFVSKKFSGKLKETEEARPHWVDISKIPCANMWEDDQYWLPEVLAGGKAGKRFYFDKNCKICKVEEIYPHT